MKRFLILLLTVAMVFMLTACTKSVSIPDVSNVQMDDAKQAILNVNLIPSIEYADSDTVENGQVIRTVPDIGTKVKENTKVVLLVSNREKTVVIPDVSSVEFDDAKQAILNASLIPSIEYEYSDNVAEGEVICTDPTRGTEVKENSKVTLVVSCGPQYIEAEHATISWKSIGTQKDEWTFESPCIIEDNLAIYCMPTFATALDWHGSGDEGFGEAATDSSFSDSTPITINYTSKHANAGEEQDILLSIPLSNFDTNRPTSIYTKLYADVNGVQKTISVDFLITW